VGPYPTLWRILEQFQSRNRVTGKTIKKELKRVFFKFNFFKNTPLLDNFISSQVPEMDLDLAM
jgi:hypothetical protein